MKIAISGSTGFIGTSLCQYLSTEDNEVVAIQRALFKDDNKQDLFDLIDTCDIVINLAGAPINKYWSNEYKEELYESRIFSTRMLVAAINKSDKCRLFISTSAVGYYDSAKCYDESNASKGSGFLAELCKMWEQEALNLNTSTDVRVVIMRLGIVLAPDGGALKRMLLPIKTVGVAVVAGDGNQSFAWIGRDDLFNAISFIIKNDALHGIINLTAPEQLTQRRFTEILARHYNRKYLVPIPSCVIKFVYGEASEVMLNGQCVVPRYLIKNGFQFKSPTLKAYLNNMTKDCKQIKEAL